MLIRTLARALNLLPGFHTSRKILVIESDDWGSIRTASASALDNLRQKGYPVDQNPYNRFDALESNEDVDALANVLFSITNGEGQHPIMTINNIVANPDFDAIKTSGFSTYHYEPFTETLQSYPDRDRVISLFKEGIKDRIFKPQFHGREHLHVNRWMNALSSREKHALDGFELKMFSFRWRENNPYQNEYMDALDCDSLSDLEHQVSILRDGLELFYDIWGFKSESFIANCYIWHSSIEKVLREKNIRYLQGLPYQFEPKISQGYTYRKRYHYTGESNRNGLYYLVRNAFFEPSVYPNKNWVKETIDRISLAFRFYKPAIISSHRLNFIGSIDPKNREKNLSLYKEMLTEVVNRWPDIEFMASNELGQLISES